MTFGHGKSCIQLVLYFVLSNLAIFDFLIFIFLSLSLVISRLHTTLWQNHNFP